MHSLFKLFKALNSNQAPSHISLSFVFGMILGLTPFLSPHNLIILLLIFLLRVNVGAIFLSLGLFTAIGYLLDPIFNQVGSLILHADSLNNLFTQWYNNAFMRWVGFNYTGVVGSVVVSVLISPIMYFVFLTLIKIYREKFISWIRSFKFFAKDEPEEKQKGWFRLSGLLVLAGISTAVFLVGYIGFSTILKNQIEKYSSIEWGAKVEISSIGFNFSPIGISVEGLAMTDKDKPMENIAEIASINANINLYHLVVGRKVFENIVVSGIAMHQPREESGALVGDIANEKQIAQKLHTATKGIKVSVDAKKYTPKKEDLVTTKVSAKVKKESSETRKSWDTVQKTIPTNKKLKNNQDEFDKLSKEKPHGLIEAKNYKDRVDSFIKRVATDSDRLNNAQKDFRGKMNQLKTSMRELKGAPNEDIKNIKKKYGLNPKGISNISSLLFGSKVQQWVDRAQWSYEKAKPFIKMMETTEEEKKEEALRKEAQKRNLGSEVSFKEFDIQPNFIAHKILVSSQINDADLNIKVKNLNFEHSAFHKTTSFVAVWMQNNQKNPLTIKGKFNHINPKKPKDKITYSCKGYKVSNWSIVANDKTNIAISKAKADLKATTYLFLNKKTKELDQATTRFNLKYTQVDFDLSKSKKNSSNRYLSKGFSNIHSFDVVGTAKGNILKPSVRISSDLDKKITNAYKKIASNKAEAELSKIRTMLEKQAKSNLKEAGMDMASYKKKEAELNSKIKQTQDIIKSGIKEKAKEEVKRRIKEVADKKANKIANDIRNKLKSQFKF